ncbi:Olfactory receptor 52J3 [Oryzias melastigma]|uniref:Olfactory receptor 52J3 n=2 Tax=Oryzias melastigma TaxID=30732 RepID=A0A834L1X6_ORYME|nr:Olfactory receptor 52J3 [Oryzias melastigma]
MSRRPHGQMQNSTGVVLFSLSGISGTAAYRLTLFCLSFLCYSLIWMVNVFLILVIIFDQSLHEPMYIILCNLCINGLYGTAGFYPKFLSDLLFDRHVVSYTGCFLQIYVIYSYAKVDFSIIALMAYDRYVAICRPLEYHSVMSLQRTAGLVMLSWLVPLSIEMTVVSLTSTLKLCGSHIDKLYCENWSVVKLACGSTTANDITGLIFVTFYICHVLWIAFSYVQIIRSALKSREGKGRFVQTCVPHFLCVINVTASLLFDIMYSRYGSASLPQALKNFMAIQFLLAPPVLNPVVYGLMLTKIRRRMIRVLYVVCDKLKLKSNQ